MAFHEMWDHRINFKNTAISKVIVTDNERAQQGASLLTLEFIERIKRIQTSVIPILNA